MGKTDYTKLVIGIFVCEVAGLIGSLATFPAIPTWYSQLAKPWFSPPNFVFGPVWTILYAIMGASLYLVIKKGLNSKNTKGFYLFGTQLSLNILWSLIFFGLKNPFAAFIEIIFLEVSIILTAIEFYKIDKKAAYLLVPYILWVAFAAILNFWVWRLNL